jgi:hypothetical protein
VAERPKVFDHVGLLTNQPPSDAELLLIKSPDYSDTYRSAPARKDNPPLLSNMILCLNHLPDDCRWASQNRQYTVLGIRFADGIITRW